MKAARAVDARRDLARAALGGARRRAGSPCRSVRRASSAWPSSHSASSRSSEAQEGQDSTTAGGAGVSALSGAPRRAMPPRLMGSKGTTLSSCFTVVPPVRNAAAQPQRRCLREDWRGTGAPVPVFCPCESRPGRGRSRRAPRPVVSRLANAARTGRGASRQVAPAGADHHAAQKDAEQRRRAAGCAARRPSAGRAATRRASGVACRKEHRGRPGRPPRHCVRSEVECQSALRSVRDRGEVPRPGFQRFHSNRRAAKRQRNYACRAFQETP